MSKHRTDLPQRRGESFLTDGGLETTLVFQEGVELPQVATLALGRVEAATGRYAAYYLINCAHPTHFEATLGELRSRILGLRANASRLESRRARLRHGPGPRRSGRARAGLPAPAPPAAEPRSLRRLLRHRSPAGRADRRAAGRAAMSRFSRRLRTND
jgi:hypothetical protein